MTLSYSGNMGGRREVEKRKLDKILESHAKWLNEGSYGNRAGLKRADLEGADLSGADLSKANLIKASLPRADLSKAYLIKASLHRADLERANLRGTNLREANLSKANLLGANLRDASLHKANLSGATLLDADLRGAILKWANIRGVKLEGASLEGAILPTGVYQVVGAGSYNRCTTYDSINDQVVCGCWDDGAGNHLDSFEKRIEEVYGAEGEEPNLKYYTEYMSAIAFFKAMKEFAVRQSQ